MLSNEFIQSLSRQAAQIFPAAKAMQKEIERNLYDLLKGSFSRLKLVTREEFDTQLAVLEKASQTICELENKIAELGKQIQAMKPGDSTPPDDGQTSDKE